MQSDFGFDFIDFWESVNSRAHQKFGSAGAVLVFLVSVPKKKIRKKNSKSEVPLILRGYPLILRGGPLTLRGGPLILKGSPLILRGGLGTIRRLEKRPASLGIMRAQLEPPLNPLGTIVL